MTVIEGLELPAPPGQGPARFRGIALTPAGLARLAGDAVAEGPGSAPDVLLRPLRHQGVLAEVAAATGDPWVGELLHRWDLAADELGEVMAIQGGPRTPGRPRPGEDPGGYDAMLLQLLTDDAARDHLRDQLRGVAERPGAPAWFQAAVAPGARVGRLLAAGLLLPSVEVAITSAAAAAAPAAAGAAPGTASDTGPMPGGSDAGSADPTVRIPVVTPPRAGAPPGAAATAGMPGVAGAAGTKPPAAGGDPQGGPGGDPAGVVNIRPVLQRLVAPGLGATVAALALWRPAPVGLLVLAWLTVDRLASWLADPFLRLVGGWPPRIRGWDVVWLPFRLVGLVLMAPWTLLGSLVLLALWLVGVDRALTWWVPVLEGLSPQDPPREVTALVARWFVPVAAGGAVAFVAVRRRGSPPLRGVASLAGAVRHLPVPVLALAIVAAGVLLTAAVRTPAVAPWEPHTDHRAAARALLPDLDQVRGWLPGSLGDLPLPGGDPDGEDPDGEVPDGEVPGETWTVVDAAALNVRAGPGTDEPVVGRVVIGDRVAGTGRQQALGDTTWVELRLDDGTTGWASGRYLERDGP